MWASKAITQYIFEHFSQTCVLTNTAIIIDPSLLQDEVSFVTYALIRASILKSYHEDVILWTNLWSLA